jgi:hypothetical protein
METMRGDPDPVGDFQANKCLMSAHGLAGSDSCSSISARQTEAVVAMQSAALKAAMNRRSVDTASTFESLRLRSTIPRRPLISPGLVGPRRSQPYSTHFSKLILVSQQKCLSALEHGGQKMIPARKLRFEFRDRIYGWVDRAADTFLNITEPRKYSGAQQSHIACLAPRL